MSVQATTWVWDHSTAQNAGLLVMLAIADSANREGAAAMQSVPTIARMCRITERHVARCIAKLVEIGELEKTGQSQRYGTTVYRLPGMGPDPKYPTPDFGVTPDNPSTPDIGDTQPLTSGSSTPDLGDTQPQRTPQEDHPTSASGDARGVGQQPTAGPDLDALFADWWQVYPKKVDRKKAREAFAKAHKRVGYDVLRAGLVRYVKALTAEGRVTVTRAKVKADEPPKLEVKIVEGAKVLNPTTWLNGDRWEDQYDAAAPAADTTENGADSWMHRTPGEE